MKKICFFSALIIICALIGGCADSSRVLFDYQNELSSVSALFEASEGVFGIEIRYGETGAVIEIKEPESIAGICFCEEGDSVFAVSDSVRIPLSPSLSSRLDPVFDAFRLSPESIVSMTKDESSNTVYTVTAENGAYTVSVNKDAMPVSIAYEGERTFFLTDIILQKNDLTT